VKLGGVLDYTCELLRTILTGIVAVAECCNFRIQTAYAPQQFVDKRISARVAPGPYIRR